MMEELFNEVQKYIESGDWVAVMTWAEEHHETTDFEIAAKVMECYKLCMAQNIPEAYLDLGTFYYNGVFVEQDYKKAFELYKVAADAGVLRAICNCGYCFYYGRHQEKDYVKAFEYFNKGALLFDDVNCLYKIGDMYLNGYATDKNENYAFIMYQRALDQIGENDMYCQADVYFRLGKCYLYGIGTEKDAEQANRFLAIALLGFYDRRRIDPFVKGLIASTKKMIDEARAELDGEILQLEWSKKVRGVLYIVAINFTEGGGLQTVACSSLI